MSRRIHIDATPSPAPDEEYSTTRSLCGWTGVEVTSDADAVTCRLCLRERARLEVAMNAEMTAALIGQNLCLDPLPYDGPGAVELDAHGQRALERHATIDRGEDVDEGPRWSSVERAVEHLFRVLDDGAPVRSSFRSEAPVQSSGGTSSATSGREDVLSVACALDAAYDAPRVFGAVVLSVEVQRQILEWRMAGRPVVQPTAPGRKGRILRRVGVTHEQIAKALTHETGMPVTARHVQLVEGAGREAVYRYLVEAEEVRPMRGDRIPFDAVVGLPAIAEVLGVSAHTAARYVDSAPVRRAFRRGRVTYWSREEDLRAWMAQTRGPWTWAILEGA